MFFGILIKSSLFFSHRIEAQTKLTRGLFIFSKEFRSQNVNSRMNLTVRSRNANGRSLSRVWVSYFQPKSHGSIRTGRCPDHSMSVGAVTDALRAMRDWSQCEPVSQLTVRPTSRLKANWVQYCMVAAWWQYVLVSFWKDSMSLNVFSAVTAASCSLQSRCNRHDPKDLHPLRVCILVSLVLSRTFPVTEWEGPALCFLVAQRHCRPTPGISESENTEYDGKFEYLLLSVGGGVTSKFSPKKKGSNSKACWECIWSVLPLPGLGALRALRRTQGLEWDTMFGSRGWDTLRLFRWCKTQGESCYYTSRLFALCRAATAVVHRARVSSLQHCIYCTEGSVSKRK